MQKAPVGAFCNTIVLHNISSHLIFISFIHLYRCLVFGFHFKISYRWDDKFSSMHEHCWHKKLFSWMSCQKKAHESGRLSHHVRPFMSLVPSCLRHIRSHVTFSCAPEPERGVTLCMLHHWHFSILSIVFQFIFHSKLAKQIHNVSIKKIEYQTIWISDEVPRFVVPNLGTNLLQRS